jgi:hypothetical protein
MAGKSEFPVMKLGEMKKPPKITPKKSGLAYLIIGNTFL